MQLRCPEPVLTEEAGEVGEYRSGFECRKWRMTMPW